jgi:hypothetical protein
MTWVSGGGNLFEAFDLAAGKVVKKDLPIQLFDIPGRPKCQMGDIFKVK